MDNPRRRRVGLLGGSFDPPHKGHLWMADRARRLLDLDEVWLLPSFLPPHKDQARITPYEQRLDMLRLLAAELSYLRVDDSEKDKGGISYTVDLVRYLKGRHGEVCDFMLLVGEDSLRDVESWKDPEALFDEIEVVVLAREGFSASSERKFRLLRGKTHPAQSRLIRKAIAAGKEPPWLTDSVKEYIEKQCLYQPERRAP